MSTGQGKAGRAVGYVGGLGAVRAVMAASRAWARRVGPPVADEEGVDLLEAHRSHEAHSQREGVQNTKHLSCAGRAHGTRTHRAYRALVLADGALRLGFWDKTRPMLRPCGLWLGQGEGVDRDAQVLQLSVDLYGREGCICQQNRPAQDNTAKLSSYFLSVNGSIWSATCTKVGGEKDAQRRAARTLAECFGGFSINARVLSW